MSGRKVTKEELEAHVAAWPRPLLIDLYQIIDPPRLCYIDPSYGGWPDNVVASYSTNCWLDDAGNVCPLYDCNWTIHRELPSTSTGEPQ